MPNLMHVIPRPGQNTAAPLITIPPRVYLYDDFERADTTQPDLSGGDVIWDATGGWRISNGDAICNGTGAGVNGRALTDTGGYTDYRLTATTTAITSSSNNVQHQLLFRCDSNGNRYQFRRAFTAGTGWRTELQQVTVAEDGTETVTSLGTDVAGVFAQALWQITVKGRACTIQWGANTKAYTLPADGPLGGLVGMACNNGQGFSDFGLYNH